MDKKDIKLAVEEIRKNNIETFSVNFIGKELEVYSGTYHILEIKKGRGKGGSTIFMVNPLDTEGTKNNNVINTISSSQSDDILNIQVGKKVFGYKNLSEVPKTYPVDIKKAVIFKEQLKNYIPSSDFNVEIDSTEQEFNGKFVVKQVRQATGRYGQVILSMISLDDGQAMELGSYKHSGIINRITVISQ